VHIEPYEVLDTHRASSIRFDNVQLGADSLLGPLGQGESILQYVLDVGRLGQSAELLGVAQEAFERTVEYLKERVQFGVVIGSFQALQHRAAILFGDIEMCKSLVINSLQKLDNGQDDLRELASMTKAKLCETAALATAEAIQMHGGIGMTDEFDIGFYFKRARILESFLGDRYYHLDRYALSRGY
jgi:alkylation response protein AidB-like acyl-CoA dehydrogenase